MNEREVKKMRIADWNIEAMCGYKPQTTFYTDFSIADAFGVDAIKDTYKRAFDAWKADVVYLTELVMVLNWKIWEHYDRHNERYQNVYHELWERCDDYAVSTLKGDDLTYFFRTTD